MTGRFLSQKDMSAARHEWEVLQSRLKRGEIVDADKIVRLHHIVCGCGAEGCIFMHLHKDQY